jgi:DNA topoisomerase I
LKARHATSTQLDPVESARAVGLRYVTDAQPGLRRIKSGQGFRYVDERGRTVRAPKVLGRIRSLAIPPAWTNVWICPHENGHLQATGRDAKRRKQHRYHPLWREVRDTTKYDHMIEFAETLSGIRRRIARDLKQYGLSREKVLAAMVRLMDLTFIRVGNDEYAKNNRSYGLTTLKDQHAKIRGERVHLSFRGKSGKYHSIEVEDPRLAKIVRNCQDIPGQELFQWINGDGTRHDVTSGDVNDYLRAISGSDFTAKDFRTWAGTVLAAQALKATGPFETQRQAKKNVKHAIEVVAAQLGNTAAVCRQCYIHPLVTDGYLKGKLPCNGNATAAPVNGVIKGSSRPKTSLGCDERTVLQFLKCCRREEQTKVRGLKLKLKAVPRAWRPRVVRGMRVGPR